MLVLACTVGLFLSILMAVVTALIEFTNLFVLRPVAKILKILIDYLVCCHTFLSWKLTIRYLL